MNKKAVLLLAGIAVIIIWPFIAWQILPEKPLNIIILDKTVPVNNYREHQALMWLLNNSKYVNSITGQPFVYDRDYYGFFPLPDKQYAIKDMPRDLHSADLIYLTDAYGVYTEDFYGENIRGERSKLIYGGLSEAEALTIKKGLNEQNLLVVEFNTLASPTGLQARTIMEDILGVNWTGWIGRYFDDLSAANTEIPGWLIRNYECQYARQWPFTGAGFAFVHSDDRVVILQAGKEVGPGLNRIIFTPAAQAYYNVENAVKYNYWFDIVAAGKDAQVLANYDLDVTAEGAKVLSDCGLPSSFPAVVKRSGKYNTYYFAGDFADNDDIPEAWAAVAWRQRLGLSGIASQKQFYWQVYFPLMKKILQEVNHEH